jgi:hypothetical protein
MSDYDKRMQIQKEIEAWEAFKKVTQTCLELHFSEKQLIAHVNIKYCDVKGESVL